MGLGRLELVEYFTFSDFIDLTARTAVLNGLLIGVFFVNDRSVARGIEAGRQSPPKAQKILVGLVIAALAGAIALVAYWGSWSAALFVTAISIVFIFLEKKADEHAGRIFGTGTERGAKAYITLLFIAFTIGYSVAPARIDVRSDSLVKTETGDLTGKVAFSLERGLVLLTGDTHVLVPWSQVRLLSQLPKETKSVPKQSDKKRPSAKSAPAQGT